MKKIIMFLFVLVSLVGCKQSCTSPASAASLLSTALQGSWGCTGVVAMNSDLNVWFAGANLCQNPSGQVSGTIAMMACPFIVEQLRKFAGGAVPASWQCDPNRVGGVAATALGAVCELLPF